MVQDSWLSEHMACISLLFPPPQVISAEDHDFTGRTLERLEATNFEPPRRRERVFLTIVTVVALLLVSPMCHAEVYKCQGPNGIGFRNTPCPTNQKTVSIDGLTPAEIDRNAAEVEKLRQQEDENRKLRQEQRNMIERDRAKREVKPSTEKSMEQTYRDLPTSTRYHNPNATGPCRNIVDDIRRLENDPGWIGNPSIQRQWNVQAKAAMALGCDF